MRSPEVHVGVLETLKRWLNMDPSTERATPPPPAAGVAAGPGPWVPAQEEADHTRQEQALRRLCSWEMRGVAYLVLDGCGDPRFGELLWWLSGQGSEVYEAVAADPQRLPEFLPRDLEALDVDSGFAEAPFPLSGTPWDEDDALPELYPRAAA